MYCITQRLTLAGTIALLFGLGAVTIVLPDAMLARVSNLAGDADSRGWLMRGYGVGLVAIALALFADHAERIKPWRGLLALIIGIVLFISFYLFCHQLDWWWIDDAGITFAYARSLADGAGLTFFPGEPPTEGYSSTLWMLILSFSHAVGIAIPTAAKIGGIALSMITLVVAMRWIWTATGSAMAMVLTVAATASAPFVVWSASGQEHALQGLLLILTAYCVHAEQLLSF